MLRPVLAVIALAASAPGVALAGELTMAGEPTMAGDRAPAQAAAPAPAPSPPRPDTASEEEEKSRHGVNLGGSWFVMTAAALDNMETPVFLVRPSLELYASIGLGDVTFVVGGSVLGAEMAVAEKRSGFTIPMLLTAGIRDDKWLATGSAGVSIATDNSYGSDVVDDEQWLPSPRAEVRAGYRIENFTEIMGVLGGEGRLYENRENETRVFLGVAIGIGGDGNQGR